MNQRGRGPRTLRGLVRLRWRPQAGSPAVGGYRGRRCCAQPARLPPQGGGHSQAHCPAAAPPWHCACRPRLLGCLGGSTSLERRGEGRAGRTPTEAPVSTTFLGTWAALGARAPPPQRIPAGLQIPSLLTQSPPPPVSCQTTICCHDDAGSRQAGALSSPHPKLPSAGPWAQSKPLTTAPTGLRDPCPSPRSTCLLPKRQGGAPSPARIPSPWRRPAQQGLSCARGGC